MKFSRKLMVGLFLALLCSAFSAASAQTNSINGVTSPTFSNLNSVYIISNTTGTTNDITKLNAWAVGDGGVIAKWDGASWATVNTPTTSNLYKVIFLNTTYGWAVGGNANSGVILRYNGTWTVWSAVTNTGTDAAAQDTINNTLYGITMDHLGLMGWVVGANGTIYGWNGEQCYAVPSGTNATLRSVCMTNDNSQAWAVGDNGTILTWTNSTNTWTKLNSPTNEPLYDVQITNATYGWAVGGAGGNGTIISLNSSGWAVWKKINFGGMMGVNSTVNDRVNATLYSLSLNNATSAWAVGDQGTVLYWGGTQWDGQSNVANADLRGVSMVHGSFTGFGQAWAVGTGGMIIAWAGSTWVPEIPFIALPAVLCIGVALAVFSRARSNKRIRG